MEEKQNHPDSLAFIQSLGVLSATNAQVSACISETSEGLEFEPEDDLISLSDGRYWEGWDDGLSWAIQTLKTAADTIREKNPLMADFWERTSDELRATAQRYKESQGFDTAAEID